MKNNMILMNNHVGNLSIKKKRNGNFKIQQDGNTV